MLGDKLRCVVRLQRGVEDRTRTTTGIVPPVARKRSLLRAGAGLFHSCNTTQLAAWRGRFLLSSASLATWRCRSLPAWTKQSSKHCFAPRPRRGRAVPPGPRQATHASRRLQRLRRRCQWPCRSCRRRRVLRLRQHHLHRGRCRRRRHLLLPTEKGPAQRVGRSRRQSAPTSPAPCQLAFSTTRLRTRKREALRRRRRMQRALRNALMRRRLASDVPPQLPRSQGCVA